MLTLHENPWISPHRAALALGVSEMMVYKYALLGKVRSQLEAGENVRFHRGDVEKLARSLGKPARASDRN